jgi:hypothetical protein
MLRVSLLWGILEDVVGRASAVGIATHYRLVGSVIESRWGKIFRASPDRPWGPPSLLYNGIQVSLPAEIGWDLGFTTRLYRAPKLKKG